MLSKEVFVDVINDIKKAFKYQSDLNDFFKKHGADGYIFQPDCSETAISLLEHIFGDKDGWISYFMFELEFGEQWHPGIASHEDGKDILLSTPEELYDFLINNR